MTATLKGEVQHFSGKNLQKVIDHCEEKLETKLGQDYLLSASQMISIQSGSTLYKY